MRIDVTSSQQNHPYADNVTVETKSISDTPEEKGTLLIKDFFENVTKLRVHIIHTPTGSQQGIQER